MEENPSDCSWRKTIDESLKRLHSLLFGADLALQKGDFYSAQILSLRLLGFLNSQTQTPVDEAFVHPIRREAMLKLDCARRSLAPESDKQAFEQAKSDKGCPFVKRGEIDIEKIKQSKYFHALFYNAKGNSADKPGHQSSQVSQLDKPIEKLNSRSSKVMTQTKLTTLYGSKVSKTSNSTSYMKLLNTGGHDSEECIIIDKEKSSDHKSAKDQGTSFFSQVAEEERSHGNSSGRKRVQDITSSIHGNRLRTNSVNSDIRSPKSDIITSPSIIDEASNGISGDGFVTAKAKLEMDIKQKHGHLGSPHASVSPQSESYSTGTMRSYGVRSGGILRRGVRGNFVPPIRSNAANSGNITSSRVSGKCDDALEDSTKKCLEMLCGPDGELPEKLRNLEPRLIEHVSNEIMDRDPNVRWDDIAGLEHAKKCVTEMVIWPLLRPDIFRGCRSPGRGLLLFGPPGTGKTMIGKAIAGEAKATFFYISASSLTSKWIGEGEKLVRALFGVASCRQPAVIFVDEIDSLLSQRKTDGEHESSRRLKTQFLIEMEGFDCGNEQILLIGATNRPQELDEAARRRLTKRLYIPLPSTDARAWIVRSLLVKDGLFKLSEEDIVSICSLTEGYSGSDMKNLVKDATMGPLREALMQGIEITKLTKEDMRPVILQDFVNALQEVRPSVSVNELGTYEEWNRQFGSLSV
ncbi:ATPase family AAA domain-containing protein FIGL1 isoform X2 [Aristolochia californica]|uniref:ATPase family AAA domain-containing protein FIGL1 isoform X2 n=1 Tax=Aristolochia californica TaxID=171875 RepID=UPI0035E308FE